MFKNTEIIKKTIKIKYCGIFNGSSNGPIIILQC